MLEIDSVRVLYGRDVAIDDLSWQAGTSGAVITALLGPSGCGKSTLIRAVAGLEPLAAGVIRFDGRDLSEIPTHRRDFGVVFQDGQLFDGRSVASNVGYGLRMRKWSRSAIAERVDEMLALVELSDLRDRRVDGLSGGQAQRVALARALAPRPRLLLLDEPLTALDRRLREELAIEIGTIVRATATPTIMVTHDHTEAALMADEVSVMRAGAIVQSARPTDLWRRPVDDWTAGFLGCDVIVDGQADAGHVVMDVGTARLAVALPIDDGPVRLGLRPESLVATPGTASSVAVVTSVAALPGGPRLRVRIGGLDVTTAAAQMPSVGDRVDLAVIAERVAVIGR